MKIIIDLELSSVQKRLIRSGVVAGVVIGALGIGVAFANYPYTPQDGQVVSAANIKADFDSFDMRITAVEVVQSQHVSVRYHLSANGPNTPANSFVAMTYDAKDADSKNSCTTGPWKFKAPVAGNYAITAAVAFQSNASDYRAIGIFINNSGTPYSTVGYVPGGGTAGQGPLITDVIPLAMGDTVTIGAQSNSWPIVSDPTKNFVSVVGPF